MKCRGKIYIPCATLVHISGALFPELISEIGVAIFKTTDLYVLWLSVE